ncbi:5'-deoxynucleotidase YfbR [uncultured archaeon]|nr:5'-deoxynucleotidase YfbR [uncultured archaeon]
MSNPDLIRFFQRVNRLKRTERTGWVIKRIKKPESVAEHSFRTAILAYVLTKDISGVDTDKLITMALIHEFGEIFAGDIPTGPLYEFKNGYLERKRRLELKSVKKVLSDLPPSTRKGLFSLWKEAEEKRTVESKWLKNLDKLEMALQALDYELEGYSPKSLDEFWEDSKKKISEPKAIAVLKKAEKLRKRRVE